MYASTVQKLIDDEFEKYLDLLTRPAVGERWSLERAHTVLTGDSLSLWQIAALAKAIACVQCEEPV